MKHNEHYQTLNIQLSFDTKGFLSLISLLNRVSIATSVPQYSPKETTAKLPLSIILIF